MRIRDAKIHPPKGVVHHTSLGTRIRVSIHQGIGGPTPLIASTGNPSRIKDRAPVGIVDFLVTIDHLQVLLISGPKVRRINQPGEEVAMYVEKGLAIPSSTVELLDIESVINMTVTPYSM